MRARDLFEKDNLDLEIPEPQPRQRGQKVSREQLAARAEGPFNAVKRVPMLNLGPVVAKVIAAGQHVPNFCRYQPQIAKFAKGNPDNLAATLIFVLASQGTAWHNLTAWFPMLMEHIRDNDGLYPYEDHVPWKAVVFRGGGAIEDVWKHRHPIYHRVEKARDDLDTFRVLLTVPGLSLPKAGFACQLITGKLGCVDSVNASIFGIPLDLMVVSANQPGFLSMKGYMKNGRLTADGEKKLELYIQFLDSIKHATSDSASQQLWDGWCEIIANKIWHASSPRGQLDVRVGKARTGVPVYPGPAAPGQKELKLNDPLRPGSHADNLAKEREKLRKQPEEKRGQLIGRQHRELITGESKMDDATRALVDALLVEA